MVSKRVAVRVDSAARAAVCLFFIVGLSVCGGARAKSTLPKDIVRTARAGDVDVNAVKSNITRADYAGSSSCEPCHHDVYQAWLGSPMHQMTRDPSTARIRAPFDGGSFRFKDDDVKLTQDGGERFVEISSAAFGHHVYRVTRVIGGRYREDFAGTEVLAPRRGAMALKDPRSELILPVSFVFSPPSFRLKGYSVMVAERPGLKAGGVWNETCIFCHNTAPYLSSLFGDLIGPSAPAYQGEVVDRILPRERRAHFEVTDERALARAVRDEIAVVSSGSESRARREEIARLPESASQEEILGAALGATRRAFDASHLVELGIGCESCHGGSREHVARPEIKPSFAIKSAFLRQEQSQHERIGAYSRAVAINRTCAKCHQVLFSRYPFTWEGGRRDHDPGGSHISSGEARDFLMGGCAGALACTACHDPHAEDPKDKLRALATPQGNELCLGCHGQFRGDDALRAHAHHEPGGVGTVCINCHMPQKNMGLAYELTRYHRIGSPNEKVRVEGDRPLECALCHVDKSVSELVGAMERFWAKSYDRASMSALYGDLNGSPLISTVVRGKAHEQATAIYVLGEARTRSALSPIGNELLNRYPLVRYYARNALAKIAGRPCDINLDRDDAEIRSDVNRFLSDAMK